MSEVLPERMPLTLAALWLSKKLGWEINTDYFRALRKDGKIKLKRYAPDLETQSALLKVDPNFHPKEFQDYWSIATGDLIALAETCRQSEAIEAKPPQKWMLAQDEALLAALTKAGYDPCKLPKPKPGAPGVKSEMKKILVATTLFTDSAFDHAWKRLIKSHKTEKT